MFSLFNNFDELVKYLEIFIFLNDLFILKKKLY